MSRRYARRHSERSRSARVPPRAEAHQPEAVQPPATAQASTITPIEVLEPVASRPSETSRSVTDQAASPPSIDAPHAPGTAGAAARVVDPVHLGCTAAQLRRFIKSRPYVPMHELRRRFELNGSADDVSPIETRAGLVYLGLPPRESTLVEELVRMGDVGLELCRDPQVPMVVGVFAMRPITRP